MNENLSGLVSGLQQKADAVAASVKEQLCRLTLWYRQFH